MARITRLGLIAGLAATGMTVALTLVHAGIVGSGPIPADVLARSEIAKTITSPRLNNKG